MYRIKAEDKDHLRILIRDAIKKDGTCCDLNHIDVSQITNMSGLFEHSPFNGDISMWDVSNVTNMAFMFYASEFKSDISQWNISKVTTMRGMFMKSLFNHNISQWDTSSVKDMSNLFSHSQFNGDISNWNVSNVETVSAMFKYSNFQGDVSRWNLSGLNDDDQQSAYSMWNDSVLGYIGVIQGEYRLPKKYPNTKKFNDLWCSCKNLGLSPLQTALYIHQELHVKNPVIGEVITGFNFMSRCMTHLCASLVRQSPLRTFKWERDALRSAMHRAV